MALEKIREARIEGKDALFERKLTLKRGGFAEPELVISIFTSEKKIFSKVNDDSMVYDSKGLTRRLGQVRIDTDLLFRVVEITKSTYIVEQHNDSCDWRVRLELPSETRGLRVDGRGGWDIASVVVSTISSASANPKPSAKSLVANKLPPASHAPSLIASRSTATLVPDKRSQKEVSAKDVPAKKSYKISKKAPNNATCDPKENIAAMFPTNESKLLVVVYSLMVTIANGDAVRRSDIITALKARTPPEHVHLFTPFNPLPFTIHTHIVCRLSNRHSVAKTAPSSARPSG